LVKGKEISELHEVSGWSMTARCLDLGETDIGFGELLAGDGEDGSVDEIQVREDLALNLSWKTYETALGLRIDVDEQVGRDLDRQMYHLAGLLEGPCLSTGCLEGK
jgi:hypothetical protein